MNMSGYRKNFSDEEWEMLRKWEMDPNMPSGKEKMYHFCKLLGMDVEFEDIFNFVEI